MYQYIFDLVDDEGFHYLSITSTPTTLEENEYWNKHILNLLPNLAESHKVKRLYRGTVKIFK